MKKDENNIETFKIVLIGDTGVGKTSIMNRFITDTFNIKVLSTNGIGFNSKIFKIPELKKSIRLEVTIKYFINYKYRYGIQLVRKDSKVSQKCIIKKVMQLFWYLI